MGARICTCLFWSYGRLVQVGAKLDGLGAPESTPIVGSAPLQKCVGDFSFSFGGCCWGFSWRIFLGTCSHKNEKKKSCDKSGGSKKNPRKIHSAKDRP